MNKQRNICYHKYWIWKNENVNTNKDFFEILIKQRIKEGFYFINRGCDNDKYLFVKMIPAYKQRIAKKGQGKKGEPRKNSLSDKGKDSYLLLNVVDLSFGQEFKD